MLKHNAKSRPLHYASHRDALIFGCYSERLQKRYEEIIKADPDLDAAIIGYRQKEILGEFETNGKPKYRRTIHSTGEAFKEIEEQSKEDGCTVVKFDIEKFFSSMDYQRLLKAWSEMFGWKILEQNHYKVFKAATRLHYILLDDLRKY